MSEPPILNPGCGDGAIPGWLAIDLATDQRGGEPQPGSLYIEARRPAE